MPRPNKRVTTEQLMSQTPDPGDCFGLLYERYVGKVYRQCLHLVGESEDARDFTQDIFLKVFAKLDSFQHRSTFSTWLHSLSYNYCLDKIKLGKRLRTESLDDLDMVQESNEPSDFTEDQILQMTGLLEQIPAQELLFLKLRYEQGFSIQEIAQQYNLKVSTVKMRLKRSRDKLKGQYSPYQYEY